MNLEEIKNRCDNRYDKLRDAELDVEWLIDEVERQHIIIDQLEAKLVCYSDNALATMEQLQAEYTAYRETALVEADLLRKEVERQRLIISGKTACDERKAAAMRCLEIISNPCLSKSGAARLIRKEFGI